jgi:hypothetical protein
MGVILTAAVLQAEGRISRAVRESVQESALLVGYNKFKEEPLTTR